MYTSAHFKLDIRAGKYTSVGCYPLFFACSDGEALCPECAKSNAKEILHAIIHGENWGGWLVVGCDVNWEDPELHCAHCSERIESAYAEPEGE